MPNPMTPESAMTRSIRSQYRMPQYRIVEVSQHGRVWYELQQLVREYDKNSFRNEWSDVWKVLGNEHSTLDGARLERDKLIAAERVERVVE